VTRFYDLDPALCAAAEGLCLNAKQLQGVGGTIEAALQVRSQVHICVCVCVCVCVISSHGHLRGSITEVLPCKSAAECANRGCARILRHPGALIRVCCTISHCRYEGD
jgi:hypothetical protein